ncbi:MAG: hypothetical protein QOJ11_1427 [Frankiales bacterium]|jgi:hypothetical protein|nr:hypothetical protein [Frankiales bacterium]
MCTEASTPTARLTQPGSKPTAFGVDVFKDTSKRALTVTSIAWKDAHGLRPERVFLPEAPPEVGAPGTPSAGPRRRA